MDERLVIFRIMNLAACVPEGVAILWQGKEYDSGPLTIRLDESTPGARNRGQLDYPRRLARAEFHVQLEFPEFASMLKSLGVDCEFTQPVRATLRAAGEILDDHSFAFSGPCDLAPHMLLPAGETTASVLPGS